MAFCSKCGARLEGNERFCVSCGNDLSVQAAGPVAAAAPAPVPAAAAAPVAAAPAAPPAAAPPAYGAPAAPPLYGAPGQIPVMGLPPAPAKRGSGWIWGVIIVVAILYGLYYIGTHNPPPGQSNTPAQPGTAPQPVAQPGMAPTAPQQPGAAPGPAAPVQPGDPGPGGPNESLVQMQQFSGQWGAANGYVQISNARWVNRSNVNLASAVLECDQYAQNGEVLSQQRANLTGANQAGGTWAANSSFNMGQAAQGLSNVNCGIVAVTPAS